MRPMVILILVALTSACGFSVADLESPRQEPNQVVTPALHACGCPPVGQSLSGAAVDNFCFYSGMGEPWNRDPCARACSTADDWHLGWEQFRVRCGGRDEGSVGKLADGRTLIPIIEAFRRAGGLSSLGLPYDNGGFYFAHPWGPTGFVQDFRGPAGKSMILQGSLLSALAFSVRFGFYEEYLRQGGPNGQLGYPTSNQFEIPTGTRQDFQFGRMEWNRITGLISVIPVKALVLVDERLYTVIHPELTAYLKLAESRRGFAIQVVRSNFDDEKPERIRELIRAHRNANPGLEGVLLVGNFPFPVFFRPRADINGVAFIATYYSDLDAAYSKHLSDGSIDLQCGAGVDPHNCRLGSPGVVPPHDLDRVEEGAQQGPELWLSWMPVGAHDGRVDYNAFGAQLRPYLKKLASYYSGGLRTNGRLYMVGNDRTRGFGRTWAAFQPTNIDFYGKPGPAGQTNQSCIEGPVNHCYQRWPLEGFGSAQAFVGYYDSQPWVGEGWQESSKFIEHMESDYYAVVHVTAHSGPLFSLISSSQARALKGGGRVLIASGCSVAAMRRPTSAAPDMGQVSPEKNILVSYLYGSSGVLVAFGTGHWRANSFREWIFYEELKAGRYAGQAHRAIMMAKHVDSARRPHELRSFQGEMMLGDPFVDIAN